MAAPPLVLAGRYELRGVLGTGGMAQVHRAHDRVLDRPVAVKLLPPKQTAADVDRFRAEGRRHAAVRHPHVLPVLDAGADAGWHFLVLELAVGGSLAQLLHRRPVLPPDDVAVLLRQVVAGLAAAHRAGVVHRDVKPGNVLLDGEGRALLTDFGISLGAGGVDRLPADQVLGTPEYLSPERRRGAPATPADDVWAVGVLGHQLLTGRRPGDGPPPWPASVPADLRVALARAVDPLDRPADGDALLALLDRPTSAPADAVQTADGGPTAHGRPPADAPGRDATRPLDPELPTGRSGGRAQARWAAAALTGCMAVGGALATAFPGVAAALVR